jgi:hypothetical protein
MTALAKANSNRKQQTALSSETAPHINKPPTDSNKNVVLGLKGVLDIKTDWPINCPSNITDFDLFCMLDPWFLPTIF